MPGYQYGNSPATARTLAQVTGQLEQAHTTITELRAEIDEAHTRIAALEARVRRLRGARAEAHAATRRAEDAERSLEQVRRVAVEATEQAQVWRTRAETAERLVKPEPQGARPGNLRLVQAADEITAWNRRHSRDHTRRRPPLTKTA